MIISYYGKKFLRKYNEINKKDLSPKEFCVNIMFPLFFLQKPLMYAINSAFSNPSYKKLSYEEKLKVFFENIDAGDIDAKIYIGGYADGFTQTTSFNISTEYNHTINKNEIYFSWIGQGLAIKLGGIDFLFDNEEILYKIYLGWERYSELLNSELYTDFKGNQINTWNSHWLNNIYSTFPQDKFNPLAESNPKKGLESISWIKLLFHLSNKHENIILNAYSYKIGQTNETYGNITFQLKKIAGFLKFCNEYFGGNLFLNSPQLFEKLFGNSYSVEKICSEFGLFGFEAIKPKLFRLEEYTNKSQINQNKLNGEYKSITNDEYKYKLLNLYLMAKIDMKDMNIFIGIAQTLHNIKTKSRKNNQSVIEELLNVKTLTKFLEKINVLNEICNADNLNTEADELNELLKLVMENTDKLIDLMLLVKFNYNRLK